MKPGSRVTYKFKGSPVAATVTQVSGTGASGKKLLDLVFDGGTATLVPHGDDRVKGQGFWLLETETDTAPAEKQPIKVAEEAGSAAPDARRKAVK